MYRALQLLGVLSISFSVVYLLLPETGPYDYAAGTIRTEWRGGLAAGVVGGIVAGIAVYHYTRKARLNAAERRLDRTAAEAEIANVFGNSRFLTLCTCAGWGLMLHLIATLLMSFLGVDQEMWMRFVPVSFLCGLAVGLGVLVARFKRSARRAA